MAFKKKIKVANLENVKSAQSPHEMYSFLFSAISLLVAFFSLQVEMINNFLLFI